jgi:hypothetical protein
MRNPEAGDDTFSETSVQASATQYRVQEDIIDRRESFTEDCGLQTLIDIISLRVVLCVSV